MEVESSSSGGGQPGLAAAPFVVKTYRMVTDPATDGVIRWGRESNSFVVMDPFAFSQTLLPANFKHSNFSSFVRQLNTYGFRKVEPDRWEFAHASFLRGQTHLLRQVVRRNSSHNANKAATHASDSAASSKKKEDESEVDDSIVFEVLKLKQDLRSINERVERMWRRLQETEKRPKQMLAFLVKVMGDPELLQRLMARGEGSYQNGGKRARMRLEEPKLELDDGMDMLSLDGCEDLVGGDGLFGGAGIGDGFGEAGQFVPAVEETGLCGGVEEPLGGLEMYAAGDGF